VEVEAHAPAARLNHCLVERGVLEREEQHESRFPFEKVPFFN
jgi:hypothetical protein